MLTKTELFQITHKVAPPCFILDWGIDEDGGWTMIEDEETGAEAYVTVFNSDAEPLIEWKVEN